MSVTYKKGMKVRIYERPLTHEGFEGVAKIKDVALLLGHGFGLKNRARGFVRFDDGGEVFRTWDESCVVREGRASL